MTIRKALNNLPPGTQHAIRMRAVNAAGVSEWSTRYVFTTTTDSTLPEVPTGVTWVSSGSSFKGTWNRVTQNEQGNTIPVTRYDVRLIADGVTKVVSVVQSADAVINYHLSYEANRALFGTAEGTIEMSVRAVDNKELKSAYSTPISVTNAAPNPPTSVVATSGLNSIDLTWTASTSNDVEGYRIYNASNALLGFTAGTTFSYPTSTYTSQVLSVAAVDRFNIESTKVAANAVTPGSPFGSDTTPPNTPTSVGGTLTEADAATGRSILDVSWALASPPSDLSDFIIYYRPVGTTAWEIFTVPTNATSMVTSAIINNVVSGVNHEVKVSARDFSSNESSASSIITVTAPANTAPPQPATPTASANTMQIQVSHSGLKASDGTAMPADVVEWEVHGSTTTGFTANAANLLGKIRNGPAIVGTFAIPAGAASGTTQTWYVKVVAVDRGGLRSSASPQATSAVGLISTLNVADASITKAKITTLDVNQLEANSILSKTINIGVNGALNIDSTGIIKSNNWVSNTTGYRLSNTTLEINTGLIKAAALQLQNSNNIMHPAYASFEYGDYYYTNPFYNARGQGNIFCNLGYFGGDVLPEALYGDRVGVWNTFADTSAASLYFAKSATDYNVKLEAGGSYIISMYLRNRGTSGSLPLNMRLRATGVSNVKNQAITLPSDDTWRRYQFSTVYTPVDDINVTVALIKTDTTLPVDILIDGIQVERQEAGLTTPSPWKPPERTTIDGSGITTGLLRSTDSVTINGVSRPVWMIDKEGDLQVGHAYVRGTMVVGPDGSDDDGDSWIASGNYIANDTGWKIDDTGVIEGSHIISRADNGVRTEISNAYNTFEAQDWNMIQMFPGNVSWSPAQIWTIVDDAGLVDTGALKFASPALTGSDPAVFELICNSTNDKTYAYLAATEVTAIGNLFNFGTPDGSPLIFKMAYTDSDASQQWSFRSPGDRRINFAFGTLAGNRIVSLDEGGGRLRLDILTHDFRLVLDAAADNLHFTGTGSNMNDIPIMHAVSNNVGIAFSNTQEARIVTNNGSTYLPIRASSFPVGSDTRFKSNEKEVTNVLTNLNKLKVYDYDTPHGMPRKASQRKKGKEGEQLFRQRGLMAQDIQKIWPDAVNDDDVDGSGLAVDTYYLLSTAIQAIKELSEEVDELRKELKK